MGFSVLEKLNHKVTKCRKFSLFSDIVLLLDLTLGTDATQACVNPRIVQIRLKLET